MTATHKGKDPMQKELTKTQCAVLAALPHGGHADTRYLRRITGLSEAASRNELEALEAWGLIRRKEGSGFVWRMLTEKRGESFYEITEAGCKHPQVCELGDLYLSGGGEGHDKEDTS